VPDAGRRRAVAPMGQRRGKGRPAQHTGQDARAALILEGFPAEVRTRDAGPEAEAALDSLARGQVSEAGQDDSRSTPYLGADQGSPAPEAEAADEPVAGAPAAAGEAEWLAPPVPDAERLAALLACPAPTTGFSRLALSATGMVTRGPALVLAVLVAAVAFVAVGLHTLPAPPQPSAGPAVAEHSGGRVAGQHGVERSAADSRSSRRRSNRMRVADKRSSRASRSLRRVPGAISGRRRPHEAARRRRRVERPVSPPKSAAPRLALRAAPASGIPQKPAAGPARPAASSRRPPVPHTVAPSPPADFTSEFAP